MDDWYLRFPHVRSIIIANLDRESIVKCRLVNKSWKNSIDNDKHLWCGMIRNYMESLDSDQAAKVLNAILFITIFFMGCISNCPV